MSKITILEERAGYLLLAYGDRYAVVERRNKKFYSLKPGPREGAPMTDAGALRCVGDAWGAKTLARQTLDDVAGRSIDLYEHLR
jgi:hypothetical protein